MKAKAINSDTMQNLRILLNDMKSKTKTEIRNEGCSFSTTYVIGGILKDSNNAIFAPVLTEKFCTVGLNGKDYLIDPETGLLKVKKPSFRERIFGVSKNTLGIISGIINSVKENFNNQEIVQHWSLVIDGVIQKGAKLIQEAQERIFSSKK